MNNKTEYTCQDFIQEFLAFRRNDQYPEDPELTKLKESLQNMHKKYPDAEGYFDNDEYIDNNKCPYCHNDLGIDLTGDELWDDLGIVNEPAIGYGRTYHHVDYYDGYDDTTVEIYIKCPHCGKIFYIEI